MKDQQKSVEQLIAERSAGIQQEKLQQEEVERLAGIAAQVRIAEFLKIAQENPINIETVQKIIEVMDDPLLKESLRAFLKRLPGATGKVTRFPFRDKIEERIFLWIKYPEITIQGITEGIVSLTSRKNGRYPLVGSGLEYHDDYLSFSLQGEEITIRLMKPILRIDSTFDTNIVGYKAVREFKSVKEFSESIIQLLVNTESRDLKGLRSLEI